MKAFSLCIIFREHMKIIIVTVDSTVIEVYISESTGYFHIQLVESKAFKP